MLAPRLEPGSQLASGGKLGGASRIFAVVASSNELDNDGDNVVVGDVFDIACSFADRDRGSSHRRYHTANDELT
jgi:hypothetical protein